MSRLTNAQEEVKRLRESRVNMVYKVRLPDGSIKYEPLPLVIGVISDLAGDLDAARVPLRDKSRDFEIVSSEGFDTFMKGVGPQLRVSVPNTLDGEGRIGVTLRFETLDDFSPDRLVEKVPEMKRELETRRLLENLGNVVGADPDLLERLTELLNDPSERQRLIADRATRSDGRHTGEVS